MADPLSLAASAAGLLSLGIQVTQGINMYLDALKCRREELDVARRKNEALRHIIDSVKSTVSSPQPLNRPHAAVENCIATCEGELAGLETLVAQLAGCKDTQTWKARLQNQSRKLSYPFKQSKVQQLSQRLDQANGTLQTALGGLGLHIAQRSEQTLEGVATSIHGFSAEFHSVRSEVASIRQRSEESNILQRDHYERVENHYAIHTNSLSTIVSATQNQNTALIAQISVLNAKIDNLQKQMTIGEKRSPPQAQARVTADQAVFRVARSPPSQLRKICDDLGGRDSIGYASTEIDNLICLCTGARPKAKRGSAQWGSLLLYRQQSSSAHQSHCPWAKKTEKFGLGFFGLTKVLQVAIDISFTLSSGAGGWSLSQSFTYHPTVNPKTDPVFQAINTFFCSLNYRVNGEADKLLQEIKQIYIEGRSSPKAVDSENNTPLHKYFLEKALPAFEQGGWEVVYKALRSFGVPTTSCNLAGETWLSSLDGASIFVQRNHQSTLALCTIIQSDFAGVPMNPRGASMYSLSYLLQLLDVSPAMAEAYGCGPMGLAVLANDSEEVKRLLANYPHSALEQNSAGQTPLHLAANKPLCLQPLVKASTHSLLNQRDNEGMTALDYAMQMSSENCVARNSDHRKCSRCDCAECVAMLLNTDCEVPFNSATHAHCFKRASERARRRFVSHLKRRRQRLLQLAQLNPSIISKGGLSLRADELPDANAPLIIDLLRAYHVIIPPALDVSVPKDMFRPIFQVVSCVDGANLFFRRGFRDIDSLVNGRTPLSVHRYYTDDEENYLVWLIEHGADVFRLLIPSRQIPSSTEPRGIFAAHSVSHTIGQLIPSSISYSLRDHSWVNALSLLISRILPSSVRDSCICPCSNDGCTPLVYLLKAIGSHYRFPNLQGRPDFLIHIPEFIIQCFEPFVNALDVQFQLSSIRWITFEALGLTHTCCNPKEVLDSENSSTGIETDDSFLEGEDPRVLEMFEQMVEELQEAAQNTQAATSSLVSFWAEIWASRVRDEMEKLNDNKLSEKEREDSEAIGVDWHPYPRQEERPIPNLTGNPYRWGTWESVQWKDRQLRPDRYRWRSF